MVTKHKYNEVSKKQSQITKSHNVISRKLTITICFCEIVLCAHIKVKSVAPWDDPCDWIGPWHKYGVTSSVFCPSVARGLYLPLIGLFFTGVPC